MANASFSIRLYSPGGNDAAERQQQHQHAVDQMSRLRIGGGNVLLIFLLLWIMGVPFTYLWMVLMVLSYMGLV